MSQYYKGMPDISVYIFMLKDTRCKAAMASLPATNQTLTTIVSTALLAADTFSRTTKMWEELDPADKIWAARKTAYLAIHKKRVNLLCATEGADNMGRANLAHTNNHNAGLLDSSTMPWTT
jgi:hypothetical protein